MSNLLLLSVGVVVLSGLSTCAHVSDDILPSYSCDEIELETFAENLSKVTEIWTASFTAHLLDHYPITELRPATAEESNRGLPFGLLKQQTPRPEDLANGLLPTVSLFHKHIERFLAAEGLNLLSVVLAMHADNRDPTRPGVDQERFTAAMDRCTSFLEGGGDRHKLIRDRVPQAIKKALQNAFQLHRDFEVTIVDDIETDTIECFFAEFDKEFARHFLPNADLLSSFCRWSREMVNEPALSRAECEGEVDPLRYFQLIHSEDVAATLRHFSKIADLVLGNQSASPCRPANDVVCVRR